MDSTSDTKTSLHVVLCGYHFKNVQALKNLMNTHMKHLFDECSPRLDPSVYEKAKISEGLNVANSKSLIHLFFVS